MKEVLKEVLIIFVIITILGIGWNLTAYRDVELLKEKAPQFLSERGFTITSYDGYKGAIFHGGYTWYHSRDSSKYLYSLAVGEWRGELMLYNVECLNAVKNTKYP